MKIVHHFTESSDEHSIKRDALMAYDIGGTKLIPDNNPIPIKSS